MMKCAKRYARIPFSVSALTDWGRKTSNFTRVRLFQARHEARQ